MHINRVLNLQEKLTDLTTQLSASHLEMRHLQEDHDRLMERHSGLLQEMAAKELSARKKQEQLVIVANRAEKEKQESALTAQSQLEVVKQTYRSQMEDMQQGHSGEVTRFKKQIDDLENQIIRLNMEKSQTGNSSNTNSKLQLSLLEREAAEGSEMMSTPQRGVSASPQQQQQQQQQQQELQSPSPTVMRNVRASTSSEKVLLPLDQLLEGGGKKILFSLLLLSFPMFIKTKNPNV